MTVAVQIPTISYAENGVSTVFPVPFRYDAPTDLQAIRRAANGVETVLVYGTDYTATPGPTNSGGTLTTTVAAPAGVVLVIQRNTARSQTADYDDTGPFPAESHEQALDKAMLVNQEQDVLIARALKTPPGVDGMDFNPAGLSDGDLLAFIDGQIQRFNAAPFAGRFYTGAPGTGLPVPSTGAGEDGGLRVDLASTAGGAKLLAFLQSGVNPLPATVESKERQILSAADFTGFDATGLTPSTTAIQNALNEAALRGRHDVAIPTGARMGAVTIPQGVTLVGPKSRARIIAEAGNYITFTLGANDSGIENLEIEELAKSGGGTFRIACGTTGKDRITIENIITFNSRLLIDDSGSGNGVHTTTKLRDIQAKAHRGPGLAWTRQFAFGELDHVIIDYVGVSASDFTGFFVDGAGLPAAAGGLIMERCDVLGTAGVFTNPNQIGCVLQNLAAVRIRNTRMDTCGNDGWRFSNINGLLLDDVAAGLCEGHGMRFQGCQTVLGNKLLLFGRNYLTSPTANKDGLLFVSGNAGIILGEVLTRDFTRHGVHKEAAQAGTILIGSLQSFANTSRGVRTVGNSAFLVGSGQFAGNVAGNYDLGGTFDYLRNVQLNSGAVVDAGPGPVTG